MGEAFEAAVTAVRPHSDVSEHVLHMAIMAYWKATFAYGDAVAVRKLSVDDGGGFLAQFIAAPYKGIMSDGESIQDALRNLADAFDSASELRG